MRNLVLYGAIGCLASGTDALLLSQALLALGSAWGMEPIAIKAVSIVVVAAFQFLLNKSVSFGLSFEGKEIPSE